MTDWHPPEWLKFISTCEHCHFEKLDYPGGWRWHCDAEHPEVLAQYEAWLAAQRQAQEQEEEEFWKRD